MRRQQLKKWTMTDQERFDHYAKQPASRIPYSKEGVTAFFSEIRAARKPTDHPYGERLDVANLEDTPDLAEMHSQQFAVKAARAEEELLVEVLQEHLGRVIVADDFKDCQLKFRDGLPNGYIFAHKGVDLGVVKKEMKMDYDPGDFTKNLVSMQHTITFRKIKA